MSLFSPPLVLGVRREGKSKFERRSPVTPAAVASLVAAGVRVVVQPSPKRVFRDAEYAAAGAEVSDDLSPAGVVLGVKEVPPAALLPDRAYAFFSHTIKAQPAGMPLLDALLARRVRLFDYEALTVGGARGGRRLVAFGRFAGLAGMTDFLSGVGARALALGHSTPLLAIAPMYQYPGVGAALAAVRAAGDAIAAGGLPDALTPLTIVLTGGDGNVGGGAREVVDALGPAAVRWVPARELAAVAAAAAGRARSHAVYAAVVGAEDMVARRDGAPFDKAEYKARPELYEATFARALLPSTSLLAVCHYWDARFPRLVTVADARAAAAAGTLKLWGVTDISADFMGSVEFGREFRPIDSPFFLYDPLADEVGHDMDAPPGHVLYHCCDHLPSECAREATEHFSAALAPFLLPLVRQRLDVPVAAAAAAGDLPVELAGACITDGGALTENFSYIALLRAARERADEAATARRRAGPSPAPALSAAAEPAPARSLSTRASFLSLHVAGHLFDSNWVNASLDACEKHGVDATITHVALGRDRATETHMTLVLSAAPRRAGGAGGAGGAAGGAASALEAALDDLRALAAARGVALTYSTDEGAAVAAAAAAAAADAVHAGGGDDGARVSVGLELVLPGEPGVGGAAGAPAADAGAAGAPATAAGGGAGDAGGRLFLGLAPGGTPRAVALVPLAAAAAAAASAAGAPRVALTPAATAALSPGRSPPAPPAPRPARRVLMLGAGLVAGPALATLLAARLPDGARVEVAVASVVPGEAEALIARFGAGAAPGAAAPLALDAARDAGGLAAAVSRADAVLSLLPAPLHPPVARACTAARVPLVTASYTSPELAELGRAAAAAGVAHLHEAGLDPGIDHASACALLARVRAAGGRVTHFSSVCGGLPAPEACVENPLGYKFSWSPRGALVAMQNDAVFRRAGAVVRVPGSAMLAAAAPFRLGPGFALEVLPNRDALPYAETYGLAPPGADGAPLQGMFRGTLRYEGFARRARVFRALGLLAPGPAPAPPRGASMAAWARAALGVEAGGGREVAAATRDALARALAAEAAGAGAGAAPGPTLDDAESLLRWAGFYDEAAPAPIVAAARPPPAGADAAAAGGAEPPPLYLPVDSLAAALSRLPAMAFGAKERDVVLMAHEVVAAFPGGRVERHTATLVAYGDAAATAMARTVGVTAAVGVEIVLGGGLAPGALTPAAPAVYEPMLRRLHEEGIELAERVEVVAAGAAE